MTTVPIYTDTLPKRTGQTQNEFDTNVNNKLEYDVLVAPAINTVAGEINTNAILATDQATISTDQATISTTQAVIATDQAALATTNGAAQVALATDQAVIAESFAQTAINAPGTSATSSTSSTIAIGELSITIQPSKDFVSGMFLLITNTAIPGFYMHGQITSYDYGTGALVVDVGITNGAGTFASWNVTLTSIISPPDLNGGAEVTSGATDIVLTYESGRVQNISMTAAYKKITLPDATTLSEGGPVFIVANNGVEIFSIEDSSGNPLVALIPGNTVSLFCTSILTTAGDWIVGDQSRYVDLVEVLSNLTYVVYALNSGHVSMTLLTDTKSIIAYQGVSDYLTVNILDISGNAITAGSEVIVNSIDSVSMSIERLTDTKAICGYSTTGDTFAVVLDVAGSSITAGSPQALTVGATLSTGIVRLADDQVAMVHDGATSGLIQAVVLDVVGNAITPATPINVNSVINCSQGHLELLSVGRLLCTFRESSPYTIEATVINVTGSVLSAIAPIEVYSETANYISVDRLEDNKVILSFQGGVSVLPTFMVIETSGDTITAGEAVQIVGRKCTSTSITAKGADKAVCIYNDNTITTDATIFSVTVSVNGNKVSVSKPNRQTGTTTTSYLNLEMLSDDKALSVYYTNAKINTLTMDIYS